MRISEMITQLQKVKDELGDLEMAINIETDFYYDLEVKLSKDIIGYDESLQLLLILLI